MNENRTCLRKLLCEREQCPSEVAICGGKCKKVCINLNSSFINNLNDQQVLYIFSDIKDNVYLEACPGSGKTEVLAIKVVKEIYKWKTDKKGMAILTFTNSAEKEIEQRIEKYLDSKYYYPHFIGTFTSWLHRYIAIPFLNQLIKEIDTITIVDDNNYSAFLHSFKTKYPFKKLGNIQANKYYFDLKNMCYYYTGQNKKLFDTLLKGENYRKKDLNTTKMNFWKKGFATYDDIEFLIYVLLNKYEKVRKIVINRFPIIFIDECQDLSFSELKILQLLKNDGMIIHLIGDLNQAIYQFRKIEPEDTLSFIENNNFKTISLNKNYRSGQRIVDISNYIVDYNNRIIGMNKEKIDKPLKIIMYEKGKEKEAIRKYEELLNLYNFNVKESRIIVRNNNLKNRLMGISVNSKTYNMLEEMANVLCLLRFDDIESFQEAFCKMGNIIQKVYFSDEEHMNSIYYYCPKNIETRAWKKIIANTLSLLKKEEELCNFDLKWSEWRKNVNNFFQNLRNKINELNGLPIKISKSPQGYATKKVNDTIKFEKRDTDCRIETIHACKGMCLDSVLFLSNSTKSSNSSGGFWKEWFDKAEISEKNRLAFVAFSRAKYLLVLGIPNTSSFTSKDRNFLESLGFDFVE